MRNDVVALRCGCRARCFRDAADRDHFYNLPEEEKMSLDFILDTLIADLVAKKRYQEHTFYITSTPTKYFLLETKLEQQSYITSTPTYFVFVTKLEQQSRGNSIIYVYVYVYVYYSYTKAFLDGLSRLNLAMLLMKEYTAYPLPTKEVALIPYNYCALGKEVPWTKPLLAFFC